MSAGPFPKFPQPLCGFTHDKPVNQPQVSSIETFAHGDIRMLRLCLAAVMAIGILFSAMPAQADFRSAVTKALEKALPELVDAARHAAAHGLIHAGKDWQAEQAAERERARATRFP
jgi:hypothetical protein